jgi:hypothetical protein
MTAILLWMFGATALASVLMLVSWSRMAWQRWQAPGRPPWILDRYFMVRWCLALGAGAVVILCVLRVATMVAPAWPHPAWMLLTALIGLLISKAGLVWTATLDRRSPSWRMFVAGAGLWAAAVLWWRLS